HHVQADWKFSTLEKLLVDGYRAEIGSSVMNARQPPTCVLLKGCSNAAFLIRVRGAGSHTAYRLLGSVHQDAAWLPGRVPMDTPSLGISGISGDTGKRQGFGVYPLGMSINTAECDGVTAADRVKISRSRK